MGLPEIYWSLGFEPIEGELLEIRCAFLDSSSSISIISHQWNVCG